MRRRWLAGAAVLAALLWAAPQKASAAQHWLAYYPGAVIDWYGGPYPFFQTWENLHWPSRDTYMTYVIGDGTYKVYYPTPDASGKYYYLTPKAGVAVEDTTVLIEVKVPAADADVWVEGVRTTGTGAVRQFRSPPLVAGRTYTYDLMALWTVGGRDVKERRTVNVRAGDRITVDFPSSGQ